MGRTYRIFRADRSAAHAEARRLASQEYDLELDEIVILDTVPLEDEDAPLGWLVDVGID